MKLSDLGNNLGLSRQTAISRVAKKQGKRNVVMGDGLGLIEQEVFMVKEVSKMLKRMNEFLKS